MKRLNICWSYIRLALSRIHLVDKCLIVFMVVLLAQSAYSLFVNHTAPTENTENIDVIVRTSIAAIFGYFLSANFICHASSNKKGTGSEATNPSELAGKTDGIQDRIGFSTQEECSTCRDFDTEYGKAKTEQEIQEEEIVAAGRLQVLVATGIGIFCMILLILMRNVPILENAASESPSASAIVAQFRDLVSSCVVFLIGCPTENVKKKL